MEENYNEVKPKTWKKGEVGDFLKGTLIEVSKMKKPDAYGKIATVYSVKAKEGKFLGSTKNEATGKYVSDKTPTIIKEGEIYSIFLTGQAVGQMKSVRLGQKFMIKFTELKDTGKGNDCKVIKIFAASDEKGEPIMDKDWVDAQNLEKIEEESDGFGSAE